MATSGTWTIPAGQTEVVVTHTYGATPQYIGLTASTDLAGRTLSFKDATSTQFTVYFDSMDMSDHSGTWTIYQAAFELNNYCAVSDAGRDFTYDELGFEDDTAYQNYVTNAVARASRYIDRWCQRPTGYFNGGATITEYKDANKVQSIAVYPNTDRAYSNEIQRREYRLDHQPVISITSIHKNTASVGASDTWVEITSPNYKYDSQTGRVILASTVLPDEGVLNMRFIYVAGYASVPDEIRWACEDLVGNALKKMQQDALNGHVRFRNPAPIAFGNETVFTSDIKQLLEPYRKTRV